MVLQAAVVKLMLSELDAILIEGDAFEAKVKVHAPTPQILHPKNQTPNPEP